MTAWRRGAWKEEALEMIFLERTRQGHCQSDKHRNHFKGNTGEPSEGWGRALMGIFKHTDTTRNWPELFSVIGSSLSSFLCLPLSVWYTFFRRQTVYMAVFNSCHLHRHILPSWADLQYAVSACVLTMVWLPMFRIFNTHTDVNACNCTRWW